MMSKKVNIVIQLILIGQSQWLAHVMMVFNWLKINIIQYFMFMGKDEEITCMFFWM